MNKTVKESGNRQGRNVSYGSNIIIGILHNIRTNVHDEHGYKNAASNQWINIFLNRMFTWPLPLVRKQKENTFQLNLLAIVSTIYIHNLSRALYCMQNRLSQDNAALFMLLAIVTLHCSSSHAQTDKQNYFSCIYLITTLLPQLLGFAFC